MRGQTVNESAFSVHEGLYPNQPAIFDEASLQRFRTQTELGAECRMMQK